MLEPKELSAALSTICIKNGHKAESITYNLYCEVNTYIFHNTDCVACGRRNNLLWTHARSSLSATWYKKTIMNNDINKYT